MKHYGSPVQAAINLLSGKWRVQILWHLSFQPLRFAELRKKLPGITQKVLTEQLRMLASGALVERVVTPSVPPAVTYSLTAESERLIPMLETLREWGSTHFDMRPSLPLPNQSATTEGNQLAVVSSSQNERSFRRTDASVL
jgi:DNA-binding HxlR family transcriptional regulator